MAQFGVTPPDLYTPAYRVLRRDRGFEIRQYDPVTIIQRDMVRMVILRPHIPSIPHSCRSRTRWGPERGSPPHTRSALQRPVPPPRTLPQEGDPRSPGSVSAFRALAGYIFGANAAGAKMAMTTPVYTAAHA